MTPKLRTAPTSPAGVGTVIGSPVNAIRQASAIMNAMPSVTRTWASAFPASRRSSSRSIRPPNAATSSALRIAASQKSSPYQTARLAPRYAPNMNSEPCVRLGIRIRPKISEKPAESRNSRPPSVMLLTASTRYRFMACVFSASGAPLANCPRRSKSPRRGAAPCVRSALERRVVARIDRLRQEPLRIVGPELAHLGIDFHRGVGHFPALLLDPADEDVTDDVAVLVETDLPARRILERHRSHRLDERLWIVRLAPGLLQRRLQYLAVHVVGRGIESDRNIRAVIFADGGEELLVGRRIVVERIRDRIQDAVGLVAEAARDDVIGEGQPADQRHRETEVFVLLDELERIGSGQAVADDIAIGDLRDVGRIVGRVERRPQLLEHAPASLLEWTLEAADLFVAEGEIVHHGDGALDLHLLERVVGHRVEALGGARRGAHDERVGLALGHVLRAGIAERRHLVLRQIIDDREMLKGRERPHDHVDLLALDQLDRLGLGTGRVAAGIGDDDLDLAAGDRVITLLEEGCDPLLVMNAARGKDTRLGR